ncbi:MAG: S1C family serine protease [Syntrophomonadaceae bacterium]|jgi:serine protease Do
MNSPGSRSSRLGFILVFLAIIALGLLLLSNYHILPENRNSQEQQSQQQQNEANPQETPKSNIIFLGPQNIADMVETVSAGIVNIETSTVVETRGNSYFNDPFFRQFFGDLIVPPGPNVQQGIGTGFIISEDGYVVTNQHVIDEAQKITVNLSENEQYSAEVVGQDYELDLAVLRINSDRKFTPLKLGDSDQMRVGEWVIAIGNPYGLDHTVTAGLVSAKGRPIQIGKRVYKDLIQTDAAINPGNSGGPLLNIEGEVIGINTAVNAEAQGIGFAIPINTAKDVLNELIEKGKVIRPYMGVILRDLSEEQAKALGISSEGLVIVGITENSPAEKAGLRQSDVIVSIGNMKIEGYDQLQEILKGYKVGDTISVGILRDGQKKSVSLTLAEKP